MKLKFIQNRFCKKKNYALHINNRWDASTL